MRGGGLIFDDLFDGVGETLQVESFFVDAGGFGRDGGGEGRELFVEAGEFGPFGVKARLRGIGCFLLVLSVEFLR